MCIKQPKEFTEEDKEGLKLLAGLLFMIFGALAASFCFVKVVSLLSY